MTKTYKELKREFSLLGWRLEKFKGYYGLGYYVLEKSKSEYNDWKWVGSSLESASNSIILKSSCNLQKKTFSIKNWHKTKGSKDSWENTKTFSGISIEKLADKYYVEERYITQFLNVEKRKLLTEGMTKDQAIKFAHQYMRKHEDFR